MISLLPPKQKQEILSEEKFKMVLILGIIIIAFLVCFILILTSIKIFLSSELEIQKISLGQKEKEFKVPVLQDIENKITAANAVFYQLASFYRGQRDLVVVFEKIYNVLPSGTYLTNLNFNPVASQISIAGFSPSREILLKLKENLEKEGSFFEIYFPPSNWLGPININFSLNFKIGR